MLDALDEGGPPPAEIVVADVFVDVSDGDVWTAGGIIGETLHGARFRYTRTASGVPRGVRPGTGDRFVTFFSSPHGRNDDIRFTDPEVAMAGSYTPMAVAVLTPQVINAAFFRTPTVGDPTVDGYVVRIAMDVAELVLPGAPFENDAFSAYRIGDEPEGAISIFESYPTFTNDLGTVNATVQEPGVTGLNWGIFVVPEPGPIMLVAMAGAILMRRR